MLPGLGCNQDCCLVTGVWAFGRPIEGARTVAGQFELVVQFVCFLEGICVHCRGERHLVVKALDLPIPGLDAWDLPR